MSKSILSKVAAFACSVASVAVLTLSASAAKLDVNKDNYDLKDGVVNIVATKVELSLEDLKAAKYEVDYDFDIQGNTGFGPSGMKLVYPSTLTRVKVDDEIAVLGEVGDKLDPYITENANDEKDGKTPNISSGSTKLKNVKIDGTLFTTRFKLPETAKAGDTFEMKVMVDKFLDADNHAVAYNALDGYIKIIGETTAATTTTTTATQTTSTTKATTTTTVTTSTTKAPVTTAATTSSSAATTTTTISSDNGSGTTTTSTAKGANTTSTTKATTKATTKGGNGVKTGDAGTGVAVAALLLAAGTAVAAAKKKED
jgi:hypothetical protein